MMKIWKTMKRRYADMGSLFWVIWIVLIGVVAYSLPSVVRLARGGSEELMLAGVYACNMLALLLLCANLLRMDCRHLLSYRTAGLLGNSGYYIILLMLVRSIFAREAGELGKELLYSLDWTTIIFLGFLLQFVGRIVRRAVKIKEEQDLTI